MVEMTVTDFLSALGTTVTTIVNSTIVPEGVVDMDDNIMSVSNVKLISDTNFSDDLHMPNSLISVDLTGLNVSKMTSLSYMFKECALLEELDVSNWNTNNVTDMSYMFGMCNSLQELNLSNWDVNNVIHTDYMFYGCSKLKKLNLTNWNGKNFDYVTYMFYSIGIDENDYTKIIIDEDMWDKTLLKNTNSYYNSYGAGYYKFFSKKKNIIMAGDFKNNEGKTLFNLANRLGQISFKTSAYFSTDGSVHHDIGRLTITSNDGQGSWTIIGTGG